MDGMEAVAPFDWKDDVRSRLRPELVSKTRSIGLNILDLILKPPWTLKVFF